MDLWAGLEFFFGQLSRLMFSLGSHFSLSSLGAACAISALYFAWQRLKGATGILRALVGIAERAKAA